MFNYYVTLTPMKTGVMDLNPIAGFIHMGHARDFRNQYIIDNPVSSFTVNVLYAFELEKRLNENA